MGSRGTGRLTDYSGHGKGSQGEGGSSGSNRCDEHIKAELEDVERCPFFKNAGAPPKRGTAVKLIFRKRPAVCCDDNLLIGYLPTRFNYLKGCLETGYQYAGQVTSTRRHPVVTVSVELAPIAT